MKCPRCDKQKLEARTVSGKDIELDVCPTCRGVWFDRGELERAMPHAEQELAIPDDAKRGSGECPRCWGTLYEFIYPGTFVQVDMCGRCHGLWLDAGEIKEIGVIRKTLGNSPKSKDLKKAGGVKSGLLRFLDNTLAALKHTDP